MRHEDDEDLVKRKLEMIREARKQIDSAEEGMIVYETCEGHEMGPNDTDGMEDLLGDDYLPTDWDAEVENPPHDIDIPYLPNPHLPSNRQNEETGELITTISPRRKK